MGATDRLSRLSRLNRMGRAGFPSTPIQSRYQISRLSSFSVASGIRMKSTARPIAASLASRTAQLVASIRRGTSFLLYSSMILAGVGVVGVTGYYITQELLLPSSEIQIMHRAFHLVENDAKSRELLGQGKLKAHGEDIPGARGVRHRPIANTRSVDRFGRQHVHMHFHVDGDLGSGVVRLELIENKKSEQFEYRYLVLQVPGHAQHYLINNEDRQGARRRGFFGIHWGPKNKDA